MNNVNNVQDIFFLVTNYHIAIAVWLKFKHDIKKMGYF